MLSRWLTADVGWPSLLIALVVLAIVGLGGAALGGWGGVAVVVISMVAAIGLVFVWSGLRTP